MASLSVGAIIGIAVGGTLVVIIAASALIILHIRDRERLSRTIPLATRQQRHSRFPLSWATRGDKKFENLRKKSLAKNKQKQRAGATDSEESLTSLGVERINSPGGLVNSGPQMGILAPPNVFLGPDPGLPKITLDLSMPQAISYGNGFAQQQQSQLANPQARRSSQLQAESWNGQGSNTQRRESASPSLSELIRDFGNDNAIKGTADKGNRRQSTASRRQSVGPSSDAPHLSMLSIVPSSEALPLASIERGEESRRKSIAGHSVQQPYYLQRPTQPSQVPMPQDQPTFPPVDNGPTAPPVGHAKQRTMSVASILAMDSGSAPSLPPPPLPRGVERLSISAQSKVYENPNPGSASSLASADSAVLNSVTPKNESYGPGVAFPFNSTSSPVSTVSRNSSIFEDATTWDTSPSIGLTSPFRGNSRQNSTSHAGHSVSDANCSCPGSEASTDRRKSNSRRFLRGTSISTLGGSSAEMALNASPGYTDIFGEYASPERRASLPAGDPFSSEISPRNSVWKEGTSPRRRNRMSQPESVSRFPEDHVPLTQEQRDLVKAYRAERADATNMSLQRNSVLARSGSVFSPPTKSILVHSSKSGHSSHGKQRRRASVTIGGEERYGPPKLSPIAASEAPTPLIPEKSQRRSKSLVPESAPRASEKGLAPALEIGGEGQWNGWKHGPAPPCANPAPQMNWELGQRNTLSTNSTESGGLPTGLPHRPSVSGNTTATTDFADVNRKSSVSAAPVAVASAPFVIPKSTESASTEKRAGTSSTPKEGSLTPSGTSTSRERSRSRTRPEVISVAETFASFPAPPRIPSAFMREAKALESKAGNKHDAKKDIAKEVMKDVKRVTRKDKDTKAEPEHEVKPAAEVKDEIDTKNDSATDDDGPGSARKAAAAELALRKLEGRPAPLPVAASISEKGANRLATGVSAVERLEQRRKARREQMMQSAASGSARRQREKEEKEKEREKKGKGKELVPNAPEPVTPPRQSGKNAGAGHRKSQSLENTEAQHVGLGLSSWD